MSLTDKYGHLVNLANNIGATEVRALEEAGKFKFWANVARTEDKDLVWAAIRRHHGWEAEVLADVRVDDPEAKGK